MKKTSRRGFGKQLGLALGALPVAALASSATEERRRKPFNGETEEKNDNYMDKGEKPLRTDDTPIVVGGGSSTYIWILKTLVPPPPTCGPTPLPPGTLIPIASPAPEYPIDAASYYCYDIQVNLGSYETHDGANQGGSHDIKPDKRKKHRTKFFRE